MPKPIPFPLDVTPAPEASEKPSDVPAGILPTENVPEAQPKQERVPKEKGKVDTTPEASQPNEKIPNESPKNTEMPPDINDKNCVVIDGKKIEIKPTKVAYFRNGAAAPYNIMKNIPLTELFGIKEGVLEDNRSGDQIVFDFLVAAFDDKDFVKEKYNDFTAEQIEKVVEIFGRINHIESKYETQRKNREAQGNR